METKLARLMVFEGRECAVRNIERVFCICLSSKHSVKTNLWFVKFVVGGHQTSDLTNVWIRFRCNFLYQGPIQGYYFPAKFTFSLMEN